MFDKAKLVAKAFQLKKAVEAEVIKIEENGVIIEVNGAQQVKKLVINGIESKIVVETINKALKKSQEMAAKKMQQMGGLEGLM